MNLENLIQRLRYRIHLLKVNSREKLGQLFNLKCQYGCKRHDKNHDVSACGCDCHYEGIGRPFRF